MDDETPIEYRKHTWKYNNYKHITVILSKAHVLEVYSNNELKEIFGKYLTVKLNIMIIGTNLQDASQGNSPPGIHSNRWAPLTLYPLYPGQSVWKSQYVTSEIRL